MKLEGGSISSFQLIFIIIGFTFGSSVIIMTGGSAEHDVWLAILAGLGEGLFFVFIFTTLALRFPGKTLIEINDLLYGPYLGKVISLSYIWYFLHLAAIVLINFGDFLKTILMPETPMVVFVIFICLVSASAVRNGIEVITRTSQVLVPLTILSYFAMTAMLLKEMDMNNLLPIFDVSWQDFFKASHSIATFPFGETVAFLMVLAFVSNKDKAKGATLLGIIIPGIILTIAAVRNIGVLGATMSITTYPAVQAIRLINIGNILTRFEVLIVFALLSMGFLKISVLYYGGVLGLAQLLKLRTYLPLVLPIGVILVTLSIIQFDSMVENLKWASEIYPYYSLPFQIGFPLLSLILAFIRKLPK